MSMNTSKEYFSQKMALLKQCLSLSEELISRLDDWESLDEILSRREKIIQELQNLDVSYSKEVINSCSQTEKSQMDQLLALILDVDKDAGRMIREEQEKIASSMKANMQGQKVLGYGTNTFTPSGRFLDFKE